MSIQSTRTITRSAAIERIVKVYVLVLAKDYKALKDATFEADYAVEYAIANQELMDVTHIHTWSNEMLEQQMDLPFYRESMFDNYRCKAMTKSIIISARRNGKQLATALMIEMLKQTNTGPEEIHISPTAINENDRRYMISARPDKPRRSKCKKHRREARGW